MWPEVQRKVELEIAQLAHLVHRHKPLLETAASVRPSDIEVSALSAYLHSLYTGLENVFKQIATGIDRHSLSSGAWHSQLLRLMATPTDHRPAVISQALMNRLNDYLAFRHVFRQAYTFELRWSKMKDLVLESEQVLEEVVQSCRSLFEESGASR